MDVVLILALVAVLVTQVALFAQLRTLASTQLYALRQMALLELMSAKLLELHGVPEELERIHEQVRAHQEEVARG
jgi:hypothetical protein